MSKKLYQNPIVISDLLEYAITTRLFVKQERCESDIDSSDESQELFDDEHFMEQQKKINPTCGGYDKNDDAFDEVKKDLKKKNKK